MTELFVKFTHVVPLFLHNTQNSKTAIKVRINFHKTRPGRSFEPLFRVPFGKRAECPHFRSYKHRPKTTNTFFVSFTKREYDPNSLGQPTVKRTKQKISVNSALKKSRLRQRRLVYRPHFTFLENRIRFGIAQTTLGGGGQLRLRIMPCKEAQKGLEQIWFCPCLLLSLT